MRLINNLPKNKGIMWYISRMEGYCNRKGLGCPVNWAANPRFRNLVEAYKAARDA